MIAYLDTSALLRIALREAGAIGDLRTYESLVSSELIALECARTIDRLRNQGALTLDEPAAEIVPNSPPTFANSFESQGPLMIR